MDDIVTRLRSTCTADKDCPHAPCLGYCLPLEAAAEIKRLRALSQDLHHDATCAESPERFAADAILGMSELKAVADVLYRLADGERKMDHGRRQLEIWGVPESFIVWMLCETPKGTSDER